MVVRLRLYSPIMRRDTEVRTGLQQRWPEYGGGQSHNSCRTPREPEIQGLVPDTGRKDPRDRQCRDWRSHRVQSGSCWRHLPVSPLISMPTLESAEIQSGSCSYICSPFTRPSMTRLKLLSSGAQPLLGHLTDQILEPLYIKTILALGGQYCSPEPPHSWAGSARKAVVFATIGPGI
ncbi:hypothetical protein FHS85_004934 [Rhodoligotrophos appendicifer]